MRVAVTGATGIVGQFVVARLLREGCRVAALARTGADRGVCRGDIEWVAGGLGDRAALDTLASGADGLVHCAFHHIPGRYRGGEGGDVPGFWRVNLGGTIDLLEAAARGGVTRTVLMSSRAVFGAPVEGPIGDGHPTAPTTHYGALKAATEAFAGVYRNVVVLRPTGVYGIVRPLGRTKWLPFAEEVAAGRTVGERRAGTEVHGEDVADAVWRLLTAPLGRCRRARLQLFGPGSRHARHRPPHAGHARPARALAGGCSPGRQRAPVRRTARPRVASRRRRAAAGGDRRAVRDRAGQRAG